jgi:hypothetical protein
MMKVQTCEATFDRRLHRPCTKRLGLKTPQDQAVKHKQRLSTTKDGLRGLANTFDLRLIQSV